MIRGYSGCSIEITGNVLTKSSNFFYPADRLHKQTFKQMEFIISNTDPNIVVPKIYSIKYDNDICEIKMEYLNYDSSIDFLSSCSVKELEWFIDTINNFINNQLRLSHLVKISKEKFESKIQVIEDKIRTPIDIELPDFIELPSAMCHGDLTLSNILVNKKDKKIGLIDFLDCYIESPIMDVIKFRQDTRHKWTRYITKTNSIRLDIIDEYLDSKLPTVSEENYKLLQLINLYRIIPYLHSIEDKQYILEQIKCLTQT